MIFLILFSFSCSISVRESMLLDQSFAPNKAMEYKPFGSMRETVEPNFINNIHNLLPSNDDLYDIDHFLGLSAHGNNTNDIPCTSPERELKVDGSKINTMVQVNKEKACEDFSVSPFQRTRMVFEVIFLFLFLFSYNDPHITLPEGDLRYWYGLSTYL